AHTIRRERSAGGPGHGNARRRDCGRVYGHAARAGRRQTGGRERHVFSKGAAGGHRDAGGGPGEGGGGGGGGGGAVGGGGPRGWGDDFVGVSQTQRPDTRFEGEAVFVGHGITAPEFQWDDYKGVDVTGKVL